jgi:alkylation response protein AidB-like acyl-CoA dehydrogenase
MHFARTEEQDELAAIVRSLLDKHSDSAAVRRAVDSESGYDEGLWRALCEQVGVAALPVPEEYDGFGASLVETALVLEELGHNLTPTPLLACAIAGAALLLHADPEHRQALLPRIAEGEVATVVLDELTLEAPVAAMILRMRGGHLELLQDPSVEPVGALDQTMRLGRVEAGETLAIGELEDDGPLRDIAAALTSALQVGAAQRGLDMTVAYSLEREQFGRPIG